MKCPAHAAARAALSSTVRPHRSENVNRTTTVVLSVVCMLASVSANADCPDGQLQFSFSNLKVGEAFAILADVAGLKPDIDHSLTQSEAMKFGCTPWRVVAKELADRHNLSLRIENGVMHVSRK
jgi:hypothetical protein